MPDRGHRCLVCARQDPLHGVIVGGRQVLLCDEHHAALGDDAEADFSDLASLFGHLGVDRRGRRDRRQRERRMFPRPEGRRLGMGRRARDPKG